jgi:hypothetical protein
MPASLLLWLTLRLCLIAPELHPGPALGPSPCAPATTHLTPSRHLPAPGLLGAEAPGTWIWHVDEEFLTEVAPIYRSLLLASGARQRVIVAVNSEAEERLFRELVGIPGPDSRVRFLPVGGGLSIWARDRYIFTEREGIDRTLVPRDYDLSPLPPLRRRDGARALLGHLEADQAPDPAARRGERAGEREPRAGRRLRPRREP